MLESGCQEGDELRRVWSRLVIQGREVADWLGEEVKEVFTTMVEGIGGPSVSGQTRGIIVEATEKNKSSLLTRALELRRPMKDRHTWSRRQRDKLTSAWLLAMPGGETSMTNSQFSHFAAINLCLHGH